MQFLRTLEQQTRWVMVNIQNIYFSHFVLFSCSCCVHGSYLYLRCMWSLGWRTATSATPGTSGRRGGMPRTLSSWTVDTRIRISIYNKSFSGGRGIKTLQICLCWNISGRQIFWITLKSLECQPTSTCFQWTQMLMLTIGICWRSFSKLGSGLEL